MKKLISLSLLLFAVFIAKGQTADETLEWLRTKQPTIRSAGSNSIANRNGELKLDETLIKLSNEQSTTEIQWKDIKDVTADLVYITIVSSNLVNGKSTFIRLNIDSNISAKYAKALKHIAELKGAKLVKEELF